MHKTYPARILRRLYPSHTRAGVRDGEGRISVFRNTPHPPFFSSGNRDSVFRIRTSLFLFASAGIAKSKSHVSQGGCLGGNRENKFTIAGGSINQSVNQSTNQSINQALKQSSSQALNRATKQSSNQAVKQSSRQAIKQSSRQAINQSHSQAIKQSSN